MLETFQAPRDPKMQACVRFDSALCVVRRAGRGLFLFFLACAISGCVELLPKAKSEVTSPWDNFEQAKAAIDRIEPYRTTAADLRAQGIDPYASANVKLLTFSDIVLRFPITGAIGQDKLDPGLRECLTAGKRCIGYSITVQDTKHDRIGNFWLDALNFRRIVETTGWSFNALILLVDDRVVFTLVGGQPIIHEMETNKQPLGPLQGWGDLVPGLIR
jgi:hypothetical protein